MRLAEKNIRRVIALRKDGIAYAYYVCMKGGHVSDARQYYNYRNENGHRVTSDDPYPHSLLPVSVVNFMENHDFRTAYEDDSHGHHYDHVFWDS